MTKYRLRIRARLSKPFNIKDEELHVEIGGREIQLKAATKGRHIADSNWILFCSRGFNTEVEAREFGKRLKVACQVSSVLNRLGIDCGVDQATSSLSQHVKSKMRERHGVQIRDNVHGLDVFPDDTEFCVFEAHGEGKVYASPTQFVDGLASHWDATLSPQRDVQDVLLLMNYALMRPDPIAQIVFSFSAVEMLGQSETWSNGQSKFIKQLAREVLKTDAIDPSEAKEIAAAIEKLHKLSLRQGVLRMLKSIGLEHLKREWDDLYGKRSSLVHGLAPEPGVNYYPFAHEVVSLCGRILCAVIARDFPGADEQIEKFYSVRVRD